VDVRQLISVTTNHYRHPKGSDWPAVSLAALNATAKMRADYKFFRGAERIYNKQVAGRLAALKRCRNGRKETRGGGRDKVAEI
jgi:hypothetical protein